MPVYMESFPSPTKSGYTFDGWYDSPDYDEFTKIDRRIRVTIKKLTLYAKWK